MRCAGIGRAAVTMASGRWSPRYIPRVNPWIRTPDELQQLVATLAGCRALALDTESDSLHHYFEKVCLIQLASDRGEAWLIDPLAFPDLAALAPLGPILADPTVVKVMHGADYDVTTLKRDFGFSFGGVFDTMIAARFLGHTAFGLQALAHSQLGVELSKSNQKDDWSRRPLSPKQETYALADVQHLLALAQRLASGLREKGRVAWAQEEFDAVSAIEPARRRKDEDAYLKIKGSSKLDLRQLAVLREVHAFREARAEASDTPAFKIMDNDVLLALAAAAPTTRDDAARAIERFPRVRGHVQALFDGVSRALALPDGELPQPARAAHRHVPDANRRRVDALKAWRNEEAARSGLDISLVLPQRLIDRLADAAPRSVDELRGIEGLRRWRVAAYGEQLVAAAAPALR